jgi:hypothetical protein
LSFNRALADLIRLAGKAIADPVDRDAAAVG